MSVAYTQDGERGSEIIVLSLRDEHSPRRIDVGGRLQSAGAVWSPDGQQLAAVAAVQDTARVRIYDLDGASLTFGHREVGTELRWAPGDRILYQRTGARNFNLLDSTQSEEQSLVSNDTVGWMSSPEVAPDGSRVAVHWNRGGRTAVWVVSLTDFSQTLLLTGSRYRPVGWSADGESVYVLNIETQAIFRIPARGGMAAEVGIVPFKSGDCTLQEHGDTLSLACAVSQGTSDAWVIENFDPELARTH
jgi:Tol biopolymer transport system component